MFLVINLFCRDDSRWKKHYVKTITRRFAGSGVQLRDFVRARAAADSSTKAGWLVAADGGILKINF